MKIADVFATDMAATYKFASMILLQLEDNSHGVNVVGMFFFDDNLFCLRKGDPVGECLSKVAKDQNRLLMICDQCAIRRNLAEGTLEQCGKGEVPAKDTVDGVHEGCFPRLYEALAPNAPDLVITL